jgi:RNase P subunit RPR2
MHQNEDRKKVILRKRSACKKCRQEVGPGLTMMSVAGKDESGNRYYHHECDQCAWDWHGK